MTSDQFPRRKSFLRNRWAIGCAAVLALAVIAALVVFANQSSSSSGKTSAVLVTRGALIAVVTGSGTITAERSLNLSFQTAGTVADVLVKPGDSVTAGQALVKMDDRALQSKVTDAQAGLAGAQAHLIQLEKGNARPEEIASAQAAVKSAQVAYDTAVKSGNSLGSPIGTALAALKKPRCA